MNIDELKRNLIFDIEKMIQIIKNEFPDFVNLPDDIDLEDRVFIEDVGTISLFVKNKQFYFPVSLFDIFEELKKNPEYGSNQNHAIYDYNNMIINDNTLETYINHSIIKGLTVEEYFKDFLLHEVLHFCGSGGWHALREGINELKTRQIAKKYKLLTSCCAYSKEMKIAYELENLFGSDIINKIAFTKNNLEVKDILDSLSPAAASFYFLIELEMEKEFQDKYMKYNFSGINGLYDKIEKYNSINYSKVYELLELYKEKI